MPTPKHSQLRLSDKFCKMAFEMQFYISMCQRTYLRTLTGGYPKTGSGSRRANVDQPQIRTGPEAFYLELYIFSVAEVYVRASSHARN
jgi:hypothetical protein